jgi:hypothetical protein
MSWLHCLHFVYLEEFSQWICSAFDTRVRLICTLFVVDQWILSNSMQIVLSRSWSSDNQMSWVMLLYLRTQLDHLNQHTLRFDIASHMSEFLWFISYNFEKLKSSEWLFLSSFLMFVSFWILIWFEIQMIELFYFEKSISWILRSESREFYEV